MAALHTPISVFIAYSRQDVAILDKLMSHLAVLERNNLISIWYDGRIQAGTNWEKKSKEH